jgi:hypothetical protein
VEEPEELQKLKAQFKLLSGHDYDDGAGDGAGKAEVEEAGVLIGAAGKEEGKEAGEEGGKGAGGEDAKKPGLLMRIINTLMLYSHYTHTVLTLYSYCTHTTLMLYSHCAHTVLTLYSYCTHTRFVDAHHQHSYESRPSFPLPLLASLCH